MNNYECIRCKFITNRKSVMQTHLNKKKKCIKCLEAFNYDDEECDKLSLIKKKNKEKSELKCIYCNKIYCNNYILTKHIKEYCKEVPQQIHANTIIENHTIINNAINTTINNNINIIIPSNQNLIPFDKDWTTEHINIYLKQVLLLADNKYTDLLSKILENKHNLNVIMNKNTNVGYVYDSDNKYKNMEKNEIINLSMEKLHNELNKIKDEVINESSIKIKYNIEELSIIDDKYNSYINDKNIQKNVQNCITNLFENKSNDALKIFEEFNNDLKIEGY